MTDPENNEASQLRLSPSEFMRQLRPEYYSDTAERSAYVLDRPVLDHHLETVTPRNQTHEFEIFCRKLCERTLCPNLRPQTGPEGGGDGKADTETLPVADEIATLTYVGTPNIGKEKWAFAFSAMKAWKKKAKSDVKGIVETGRGYNRVFFVTSRYAKGNIRADLEQELKQEYGVEVTILDRSWILEEIIDKERKDLAFNYLHVGQEIADTFRLGPSDYSRSRQLEDIEKALADPERYVGMETQRATEALLAAILSRNLEQPRHETDGRFLRAIRFADADGTHRQQLETRYEHLWTAVWWFDGDDEVNRGYEEFEARVIHDDNASNLEFLSNLLQTLFNGVVHGRFAREACQLEQRASRLYARLDAISSDRRRPNNALEARTLRLIGRLNWAKLDQDAAQLSALWPEFERIFADAEGLGEYDPDSLIKIVESIGTFVGNDPAYNQLVDKMAAFVSKRTSEAEGALILLSRAKQLDFDDRFDMIRLLGRAVRQLAKREYTPYLIDAAQHLALAYRSAGLLWAARATCIFAAASIVIDGEEESELGVEIVPTFEILAWITLELRHIPDFCAAVQLLNGFLKGLPLDDSSKERLRKRLDQLDKAFASVLLNCTPEELTQLETLPDVLEALGLYWTRTSLLYALGYANELRADGSIPSAETDAGAAEMFSKLASQPVADNIRGPLVVNAESAQTLQTTVFGVAVNTNFDGAEVSTLLAEAGLAAIEACFATAFELDITPHTERFDIEIIEDPDVKTATFTVDEAGLRATLRWPKNRMPTEYRRDRGTADVLTEVATMTMAATCMIRDAGDVIERLASRDAVLERISVMAITGNSYHRLFSKYVSRLSDQQTATRQRYSVRQERPTIVRVELPTQDEGSDSEDEPAKILDERPKFSNHRDFELRSIINPKLWSRADWKGALYGTYGANRPPALGLIFVGAPEAAREIFVGWRDRFGEDDREDKIHVAIIREVSAENPAYYKVLVTSKPQTQTSPKSSGGLFVARVHQMEPETDINLSRFLVDYAHAGEYLLMPAILTDGQPTPIPEVAIVKRNLAVRTAAEITPTEIEYIALDRTEGST